MKNVKIMGPVSSGRSFIGRKIIKECGGKIGYCSIIDELIVADSYEYVVGPELREKFIYVCLGFSAIAENDERKFNAETQKRLIDESRAWKDFAAKRDLKYFDVTARDEKTFDAIVQWVKAQVS